MNMSEAKRYRQAIVDGSQSLPDADAYAVPELFDRWKSNQQYKAGDRRSYEDVLYKCLQDHTSQADWTPDVAVSLWVRVDDPSVEWPEWKQPTGAQDAYNRGDKVSYMTRHWISTMDSNVWVPGVYGWDEVKT